MTDISAAMGLGQLKRASVMRDRRRYIAETYDKAFGSMETFELMNGASDRENAHHLYVLKLRNTSQTIDREKLIANLKRKAIGTSVHFIPLHLHPYYRDCFGYKPDSLPVATDLYRRSLSLPIYSSMTGLEVDRVIAAVVEIARTNYC
jgi:dTDP-4-amino-4,6-dideoxygalactose transaminase